MSDSRSVRAAPAILGSAELKAISLANLLYKIVQTPATYPQAMAQASR